MKQGFVRVASAIPSVKVADCKYNSDNIIKLIKTAQNDNVEIICFPELSITSYTCGDLFHQQTLISSAENEMLSILNNTKNSLPIGIVGMPVKCNNQLFNCAVVFQYGKILGVVPKTFLPNYGEFYEKRWFSSSLDLNTNNVNLCEQNVPFGTNIIFNYLSVKFAIEICEDMWTTIPPSCYHTINGANLIFNLSASNEVIGKNTYLKSLISQQSARCISGYVYSSSGFGESTTDLVFSGNALIAENGSIIKQSERFSFNEQLVISDIDIDKLSFDRIKNGNFMLGTTPLKSKDDYIFVDIKSVNKLNDDQKFDRYIHKFPFVPSGNELNERCDEIFNIQVSGLATRLTHINCKSVTIGISGGLDSTLALLVAVKTFDKLNIPRKNIIGITMPGFGTTGRTYNNSLLLMENLGITSKEISIKDACVQHFKDIEHDINVHDVVYENVQARERTQILMDVSNKNNSIVIGTGDLSELSLGWATYNGDHMSMYGVNCGIPKTLVKFLVDYVAESIIEKEDVRIVLRDIINTPVSPELLPADKDGNIAQITEDIVGPYELHDFFLYYMIRFGFSPSKIFFLCKHSFSDKYTEDVILKWMTTFFKRFFSQQFKRSCLPDGPKVGSINLSPRGDWRMPSDASGRIWMEEIENLIKKVNS